MDDHRKVQERREGELTAERRFLHVGWSASSGEVHPDLADRDDAGVARELGQAIERVRSPRCGAVRMHADRDAKLIVVCGKCESLLARRDVLRRGQDAFDAGLSRAFEYVRDVCREAAIGEMRMRVDHGGGGTFTNGGGAFFCGGGGARETAPRPLAWCGGVPAAPRRAR